MKQRKVSCMLVAFVFIVSLLMVTLSAPALAQQTIPVAPGESIQVAINTAEPGDIIILGVGVHQENITVNKPLTIRGAGVGTILKGDGNSSTITINAPGVTIADLTITGADNPFYEISVNYHEITEYLTANPGTENTLTVRNVILEGIGGAKSGISLESSQSLDIEDAEINLLGNNVKNYKNAITFHEDIESIINSEVNIIDNVIADIVDFGVDFDIGSQISASRINIIDNNITVAGDHAIAFYAQIVDGTVVSIEGNDILTHQYDAISFRNDVFDGNIFIRRNVIHAAESAINIRLAPGSSAEISGNTISSSDCAIEVSQMTDATAAPTKLYILSNLIRNSFGDGIALWDITLNESDSELVIAGNSFRDNNWDLYIPQEIVLTDASQFVVTANSFAGSQEYALYANASNDTCIAHLNWWGTDMGPATNLLTDNVDFDPWLATLVITPEIAEEITGNDVSFTVTLLDNDGEAFEMGDLLLVRFTVSGVNVLTRDVLLNGTAVLTFTSSEAGTDTITAEVLFAGEAVGLETEEAVVVWEAAPDITPPPGDDDSPKLPDTGGNTYGLILLGLLMILGGIILVFRRAHLSQ